ncbi:hypothetical protein [Rugosimonospora africana]|uniref:Uncharacterized protein n=1 Tax=Rugosimonospora africana TaxID=556532 RepID=A0A8J3QUY6_9ACTN|nr:hypothetical protein [Rugosimonospora africana]GIH16280.1 hypothetical protein Raf01_44520 [Rugosimonospora africana]
MKRVPVLRSLARLRRRARDLLGALHPYRLVIAGVAGALGAVLGTIYDQIDNRLKIVTIAVIGALTALSVILTEPGREGPDERPTPERKPARRPEGDGLPRVVDEVVEEVLGLPETVAYLGADPLRERRAEVVDLVREAIADNTDAVQETSEQQYVRFQDALERMRRGYVRPVWARLIPAYRAIVWMTPGVALGLAIEEVSLTAIAAGLNVLLVGVVLLERSHRTSSAGGSRWSAIATIPYYAWAAGAAGATAFTPGLTGHTIGIVMRWDALAFPVALILLVFSLPYAGDLERLRSDRPTDWPDRVGITSYRDAARQARSDWLAALARDGVMPLIRADLIRDRDEYSLVLPDVDPARLGGLRRSDQLVRTAAADRIEWLLGRLDSASIGLSGSRGAGKSTLLRQFCTRQFATGSADLRVLVEAPVSYDRRDFLVYLFAEVCRRVIDRAPPGGERVAHRRSGMPRVLPAAVTVLGVIAVVGYIIGPSLASLANHGHADLRTLLLVVGIVLIVGGTVWTVWAGRPSVDRASAMSGAAIAASHQLDSLRYQSTLSRSRDGKVQLPGALELSASRQVQRVEYVPTYPELVAQFRNLLDLTGLEHRAAGGRVIVGIDELDKIASADEAEQFLNDLKAMFGVRGCYFLVAVSEDALAAFDRRAMGVRTMLDSAFDGVVAVRPLLLTGAGTLLGLRGIWLPRPYLLLCHALSGGLPRELIRVVLSLAELISEGLRGEFPVLAQSLIRRDIAAVLNAQIRYAAQAAVAPAVIDWLALAAETTNAGELERLAVETPQASGPGTGRTAAESLLVETTRAYLYHTATLIRAFAEDVDATVRLLRSGTTVAQLSGLGSARNQIMTEPKLAWHATSRFRSLGAMPPLDPSA